MTNPLRTVIALSVAVLTLAAGSVSTATAATSAPATGEGVRIMLAGDSITQQFDGDYTWRWRLAQEFKRQGVPVQFVGPRDRVYGRFGYQPAPAYKVAHAALGGTRLVDQLSQIRGQVATYRPDVLVTMIGHNDLARAVDRRTPEQVADDMRTYIGLARAARPDVKIVLADVMDADTHEHASLFNGTNTVLNADYAQIAEELSTAESPIVIAHTQFAGWDPERYTFDGTHLTPTGETVVAQRMAEALTDPAIHALRQPPRIFHGHVPWRPRALVRVRLRHDRRAVVDWSHSMLEDRATSVKLYIRDLRSRRPATVVGPLAKRRLVTTKLHPGHTYRFRIRPIRRWMTGDLGRVTVVVVRAHRVR